MDTTRIKEKILDDLSKSHLEQENNHKTMDAFHKGYNCALYTLLDWLKEEEKK